MSEDDRVCLSCGRLLHLQDLTKQEDSIGVYYVCKKCKDDNNT